MRQARMRPSRSPAATRPAGGGIPLHGIDVRDGGLPGVGEIRVIPLSRLGFCPRKTRQDTAHPRPSGGRAKRPPDGYKRRPGPSRHLMNDTPATPAPAPALPTSPDQLLARLGELGLRTRTVT